MLMLLLYGKHENKQTNKHHETAWSQAGMIVQQFMSYFCAYFYVEAVMG